MLKSIVMSALLNSLPLIETFGLLGVCLAVFLESGLFFGFFLPGDSLLFTAGLLASEGRLNFFILFISISISAILGNIVGYIFGRKLEELLFKKEDSRFFKKAYLERAKSFFNLYGDRAIVFARFMPIVRTFVPIVSGAVKMSFGSFIRYSVIGALIWTTLLCGLGYILGRTIPNIDHYLLPIIILIIILSFLPGALKLLHAKNSR